MDEQEFEFPGRNFAALIISKRASGKTFLCNYLLHHFNESKRFDYVVLFSQTSHISGDFKCIPKNSIFKNSIMK